MASSLNKVMLIGNLGKDAETRQTPSGVSVTSLRMATTSRYKDRQTGEWKEKSDWHDVVVWRAERIAPYLTKGKKVFVEGRLETRSWDDQNGQKRYRTEVVLDTGGLMLLGGRNDGDGGAVRPSGYGPPPSEPQRSSYSPEPARPVAKEPHGGGSPRPMSSPEDDIPF